MSDRAASPDDDSRPENAGPSPVNQWLRCPVSRRPVSIDGNAITCAASGFKGTLRDGVAVMGTDLAESFFDRTYRLMKHGPENPGEWRLCYARQTELFSRALRPGMLVLDVGCGPALPYDKPEGVRIIGLEPSFYSLRENPKLDLRIAGSAYAIPLADASLDAIVCFYAVHHMVGPSVRQTRANVAQAFKEFARVLKPGGELFVFEMTPNLFFAGLQASFWQAARRLLGRKLDMYFFSSRRLRRLAGAAFPAATRFEQVRFSAPAFTPISAVFSRPRLKIPRLLYPLGPRLYRWRLPA